MDLGAVEAEVCRSVFAAGGFARRVRTEPAAAVRRQRGFEHGGPAGKRALAAGFTYVGLLVLIAMMGVALTVVSEVWHTAQKREKEQELLFIGNQFRRAIAMFNANGGGYPQRLEDLLKDPRVPGVRRFLRRIYRDPMTGETEWGLVRGAGNAITGVYSLSDAEPLKKAQFSLADQSFEGKTKYSEWVFISKTAQAGASPSMTPVPTGAQASSAAAVSSSADGSAGATPPAASGTTSVDDGQSRSGGFGPRGRR